MPGPIIHSSANISEDGLYRYELRRIWDPQQPVVVWIMLNPSIADSQNDDATIRRCMNFANYWGYGGIAVYNLFAFRSNDPRRLAKVITPVGPRNDEFLLRVANEGFPGGMVVLAWGNLHKKFKSRRDYVLGMFYKIPVFCMGKTVQGEPKHPVRLAAWIKVEEFRP